MTRNALGRGLSALIRDPEPQQPQQQPVAVAGGAAAAVAPALAPSDVFLQVDIDLIDPSPFQPRTRFREEALEELARSIRVSGIVQPLVVRRIGTRFQLIAGERRWRAAQRAELGRVPAVVRDVRDEMALEMTLVENLQREDLNPVEQARAFQRLIDEFHLTQEEVADRTGKDRATIANSVRLLRLEEPILDLLEEGTPFSRPRPRAARNCRAQGSPRTRSQDRPWWHDRSPGRAPCHTQVPKRKPTRPQPCWTPTRSGQSKSCSENSAPRSFCIRFDPAGRASWLLSTTMPAI